MTKLSEDVLMDMQRKFSLRQRHAITTVLLVMIEDLRKAGFKASEAKPLDELGLALLRYICVSNSHVLPEHPALLGKDPK